MKRYTALLASIVMLISTFTGCANTAYDQTTETTAYIAETTYATEETSVETTAISEIEETSVEITSVETTTVPETEDIPVFTTDSPNGANTKKNKAPATIKNITNDTIFVYDSIKQDFLKEGYGNPTVYNFTNAISTGIAADGSVISCETNYYGLTSYIGTDGYVYIRAYNNTNKKVSVKYCVLENLDKSNGSKTKISNLAFEYGAVDASKFENGLYRFNAKLSTNDIVNIYFYVNGGKTYLCDIAGGSKESSIVKRRDTLNSAIKTAKVTPSNSLTLNGVCYPFKAFDSNYRCDTDRWVKMSDTIVKDSWSDERKVYAFCEWLAKNIAYDEFKVNNTNGKSRARYYNDFSGKQSTYDLRTGVCFDTANILLIMCRTHDIPAVTIGSADKGHVWNGVYVNDRWYEIDVTQMHEYCTWEADATVLTKNTLASYAAMFTAFTAYNVPDIPSDMEVNKWLQKDSNKVY